jgi:uncharacterized protein
MASTVRLNGAVALVTGASHGIGRASAFALHRRGASVGLVARTAEELEAAAKVLGPGSGWVVADVTDKDQVDRAVAELSDRLGPPDILVNNAGIGAYGSLLETDLATFERLMQVNYFGTLYATLAVLPAMVARGRGHIVNIASIAGRLGAPFESAYSASKFAVVGLSESLAAEVQGLGVHVSLINPGPVETKFTEARGVPFQRRVPRPLAPERVADAVVEAVERDRFEKTLPGWLRVGTIARVLVPSLYRRGLVRNSSKEAIRRRESTRRAAS